MTTLNDLPIGSTATVAAVGGEGSLRQHFLDMGIIPLADVTMVKHAPMGDPLEVRIHGYELTLRRDDARKIDITDVRSASDAPGEVPAVSKPVPHPGLGEGGKFHDRTGEHPLPDGTPLTFALVGNQNCGKTTLFNQLTGCEPARGQLPRRHGGPQGRLHQGAFRGAGHRSAGHLLAVAVLERGGGDAAASCSTSSRAASSTSWTPRTSSATCI